MYKRQPITYVVIAGGGSGGNDCGGGGGAGGYLTGDTPDLDVDTDMTVTVGTGAVQATPASPGGKTGNNSVFDTDPATYTALGGGAGGGFSPTSGGPGGSGGASRRNEPIPGSPFGQATNYPGPTAQGYPSGGASSPPGTTCSSGGGGAGSIGGTGNPTHAGGGGKAVVQPIVAVPTITDAGNGWVCGGGGGGVDTPSIRIGLGGGNNPPTVYGVPPASNTQSGGAGGGGGPDNPTGDWMAAVPGHLNSGGGGGGGAGNSAPTGSTPTFRYSGAGAPGLVALVYPNKHTVTNPGGGLTISGPHPHSPTQTKTIYTAGTGTVQITGA